MTLVRKYFVWVVVLMLVMIAVMVSVFSAEMPPSALSKPQLATIVGTPVFDQDGKLEAFHVVATFKVACLMPDGRTIKWNVVPVSFDLIQQGGQTVVLGNSIVEFKDVGSDLLGVTEFVWKLQHPDPLPTVRRRLREPLTAK